MAAWPFLVDCMCDEGRQCYLSANELLLVCELSHQHVAIFATCEARAVLHGSVTGHAASPICVSLHVGGAGGRVRSHFQRLVLLAELRRAAEKKEKERESASMAAADAEGREKRLRLSLQWSARERASMAAADTAALIQRQLATIAEAGQEVLELREELPGQAPPFRISVLDQIPERIPAILEAERRTLDRELGEELAGQAAASAFQADVLGQLPQMTPAI